MVYPDIRYETILPRVNYIGSIETITETMVFKFSSFEYEQHSKIESAHMFVTLLK